MYGFDGRWGSIRRHSLFLSGTHHETWHSLLRMRRRCEVGLCRIYRLHFWDFRHADQVETLSNVSGLLGDGMSPLVQCHYNVNDIQVLNVGEFENLLRSFITMFLVCDLRKWLVVMWNFRSVCLFFFAFLFDHWGEYQWKANVVLLIL